MCGSSGLPDCPGAFTPSERSQSDRSAIIRKDAPGLLGRTVVGVVEREIISASGDGADLKTRAHIPR